MRLSSKTIDLCLCVFALVVSALLFIGASELPPPRWEPLGSAAIPRAIATLIVVFSALIALQTIRRGNAPQDEVQKMPTIASKPQRSILIIGLLIAYVFSLDVLQLPFIASSTLFFGLVGTVLGSRDKRAIAINFLFGFCLSVSVYFVFTQAFYVTLR